MSSVVEYKQAGLNFFD